MANESALPADIVELLAFWVADEEYSVDILDIQEIIKLPEITKFRALMIAYWVSFPCEGLSFLFWTSERF